MNVRDRARASPETALTAAVWAWVWSTGALARLRDASVTQWRRILIGALIGWVFAWLTGAFALVALEEAHVIGRTMSDNIAIVYMLACPYLGGLLAYRGRTETGEGGVTT